MKKLAPIFFCVFAVLPLCAGLLYSLLYSLGVVGVLAQGFSLEAWVKTLVSYSFWSSLALSGVIAATVIVLSSTLALALLVSLRTQLERPRVRFLLHFPLALPPIVAAFLSFQWLGSSGMLARMTHSLGLIDNSNNFPPLINDPLYLGVVLTMTLTTFPFLLLIFLDQFKAANLLQITALASTLGASVAQIRRRVLVPVLLRRVAPTLLLYGIFLFGAYEVPLLLGRQNPAMISMFIDQKFRRYDLADLPVAYVGTVVYAVLVLVLVVVFLRRDRNNEQRLSA